MESVKMTELMEIRVRETLEMHFFDIAVEHTKKAEEDINRDNILKMQKESINSLIAIVMSVLSLEALINSIGMEFYGKNPDVERQEMWELMERKPLVWKWKYLAKTAYREKTKTKEEKTIPTEIIKSLKDLVELRHSIVHYKSISIDNSDLRRTSKNETVSPELDKYTSKEARKAIETVIILIKAFNKLARKEYGEWVDSTIKQHSLEIGIPSV